MKNKNARLIKSDAIPSAKIQRFRSTIYCYYKKNRRDMPWRNTENPYQILVSEIMLQQTQVQRVMKYYPAFINRFPDFASLESAATGDVIKAWQGLGYNRRAIALKKIASVILGVFSGAIPAEKEKLMQLPGIGKATASAILAYAFNKPEIIIETNIRAVFIHFFFQHEMSVTDANIEPLVTLTLDRKRPREWYYALMDYGVYLKKKYPRLTGKSAAYKKQSRFSGSQRQIRGKVLRLLTKEGEVSEEVLVKEIDDMRAGRIIDTLIKEGFIEVHDSVYSLKH